MAKENSTEVFAKVALLLGSAEEFSHRIKNALKLIGKYARVSRTYVFIDSPDGLLTSNEFEWCAPGIKPQIENLKGMPYTALPSLKPLLEKKRPDYFRKHKKTAG